MELTPLLHVPSWNGQGQLHHFEGFIKAIHLCYLARQLSASQIRLCTTLFVFESIFFIPLWDLSDVCCEEEHQNNKFHSVISVKVYLAVVYFKTQYP